MAEESQAPVADPRAEYEYAFGVVDRPELAAALDSRVDGEVRFDAYSRQLYATDASIYEVTPVGVVFPRSTADVAAVVSYCADREIPILPRGGATSLAGQTTNEAVVLDFTRHMDGIVDVDPDRRRARVQPGVVLGQLNDALADHELKFAPDPAWGDKSTIGGAIGNNSTGAHSLQYGKTDAYIKACEVVLADGTITRLDSVSVETVRDRADPEGDLEARLCAAVVDVLDKRATVEAAFPDLKRNVSGYNLDRLIEEAESGEVNLARLLAGSEGTLAVVTEATVTLEPVPATKSMALLRYETLADAMADVAPILEHDPAAVETLDAVLLDLARETEEFGALTDELAPPGTGAVLLVEFYAEDDAAGRERVERLLADRRGERAVGAREAHEPAARERFWTLRKSGLPILLSRTTDAKHISFIEDVAVPPAALPDFVAEFRAVLEEHDTVASFYGHAGPGCLHVRPLIDTKTETGLAAMRSIADRVTQLAAEYDGSVSGEHGDGRARTQWSRRRYGEAVWELFRGLKRAVDPDWLLNPGQVCGPAPEWAPTAEAETATDAAAETVATTENLRVSPDDSGVEVGFEPQLRWDNDNGMAGMVELCHGCGGCRGDQETTGGVMCPTYRASQEEATSTRGRANALRAAMSGDLPADPTDETFLTEVLDLCIGCKGCARDCPSEVDMAKLKAELTYQHNQRGGATLRDRLFSNVDRVSAIGSALAPVSNWLARLPGSGLLAEALLGIARERSLPTFRRESLLDWARDREPGVPESAADERVLLFPDTFTTYTAPAVGKAAVRVLEAAGVHVRVARETAPSGRAAFSKGFLDLARERAQKNVDRLAPRVEDGWALLCAEPSDAVMVQSDYLDLLSGPAVERLAGGTYGVCEYIDVAGLDERLSFDPPDAELTYHGHCHQTAVGRDHHAVGVLRRAGYAVDPLDSGCCGMAGSFGYEAEHYSMSRAIARILEGQIADSDGDRVVAPGASCRSQLADGDDRPAHPVEALDRALVPSRS